MQLLAPAKLNLCLFLGPRRADGLHRLVSLFETLTLCDEVEIEVLDRRRESGASPGGGTGDASGDARGDDALGDRGGAAGADRVEYRFEGSLATPDPALGVGGADTVTVAIAEARQAGLLNDHLWVRVSKRVPSGAGLGGGSADAAALLRALAARSGADLAARPGVNPAGRPGADQATRSGADSAAWPEVAMRVGADVPSQLDPGLSLVTGAGERVRRLPDQPAHAAVVVTGGGGLGTGAVYAEADRLGIGRSDEELDRLERDLAELAADGRSPLEYPELLVNDLEPAAASIRPELTATLQAVRDTGARLTGMSGSGSAVFGLFESLEEAEIAAVGLGRSDAVAVAAGPAPAAAFPAGPAPSIASSAGQAPGVSGRSSPGTARPTGSAPGAASPTGRAPGADPPADPKPDGSADSQ